MSDYPSVCTKLPLSSTRALDSLMLLLGELDPPLLLPLEQNEIRPLLEGLTTRLKGMLRVEYVSMAVSRQIPFTGLAHARYTVDGKVSFVKSALETKLDKGNDGKMSMKAISYSGFDPIQNSLALLDGFNHARGREAPELSVACVAFRIGKDGVNHRKDNHTLWFQLSEIEEEHTLTPLSSRLKAHLGDASVSFFVAAEQTDDDQSANWCPATCCANELITAALTTTAASAYTHFSVMRQDMERDNDVEEAAMHGKGVHLDPEAIARAVSGISSRISLHQQKGGERGLFVVLVSYPTKFDIAVGRSAYVGMCTPHWIGNLAILDPDGEEVVKSTVGATLGHAWRGSNAIRKLPVLVYEHETLKELAAWDSNLENWIRDENALKFMWILPYGVRSSEKQSGSDAVLHESAEEVLLFRGRKEISRELGKARKAEQHRPQLLTARLLSADLSQIYKLYVLGDSVGALTSCDPFLLQWLLQLEITHIALSEARRLDARDESSKSVLASAVGLASRSALSIKYLSEAEWEVEFSDAYAHLFAEQQTMLSHTTNWLSGIDSGNSGEVIALDRILNLSFRSALLASLADERVPTITDLKPSKTLQSKVLREVVLDSSWELAESNELFGLNITIPRFSDGIGVHVGPAGALFVILTELLLNALNFSSEAARLSASHMPGIDSVTVRVSHMEVPSPVLEIEIVNTCINKTPVPDYWDPKTTHQEGGKGSRLAGELLRALGSATALRPIPPEVENSSIPHTWKVVITLPAEAYKNKTREQHRE